MPKGFVFSVGRHGGGYSGMLNPYAMSLLTQREKAKEEHESEMEEQGKQRLVLEAQRQEASDRRAAAMEELRQNAEDRKEARDLKQAQLEDARDAAFTNIQLLDPTSLNYREDREKLMQDSATHSAMTGKYGSLILKSLKEQDAQHQQVQQYWTKVFKDNGIKGDIHDEKLLPRDDNGVPQWNDDFEKTRATSFASMQAEKEAEKQGKISELQGLQSQGFGGSIVLDKGEKISARQTPEEKPEKEGEIAARMKNTIGGAPISLLGMKPGEVAGGQGWEKVSADESGVIKPDLNGTMYRPLYKNATGRPVKGIPISEDQFTSLQSDYQKYQKIQQPSQVVRAPENIEISSPIGLQPKVQPAPTQQETPAPTPKATPASTPKPLGDIFQ